VDLGRVTIWQVPVVDLSQGDDEVLSTLKRACTTTGFFYGAHMPLSWHAHGGVVSVLRRRSSKQALFPVIRSLDTFKDIGRFSLLLSKPAMLQGNRRDRQACHAMGDTSAELIACAQ